MKAQTTIGSSVLFLICVSGCCCPGSSNTGSTTERTANAKKSSEWAPSVVKVASTYRSEDVERFTIIKKDEKPGEHLYMDVLVSEKARKQSVLYLAEDLRKKYVGVYSGGVTVGIWDSERVCRNFKELPEDEAYLHFLAEVQILGKKDQGQITWAGKGRDH